MKTAVLITATALTFGLVPASPSLAMGGMGGGLFNPENFDQIDTDKDGKLSKAEMEAHRAARFAASDTNKDGKLSVDELTAAHGKRAAERAEKGAGKMLEHLDKDGDGALSLAEMATPKRGEKMFARIDQDGDDMLSKAELDAARAHMKKHGRGHGDSDE